MSGQGRSFCATEQGLLTLASRAVSSRLAKAGLQALEWQGGTAPASGIRAVMEGRDLAALSSAQGEDSFDLPFRQGMKTGGGMPGRNRMVTKRLKAACAGAVVVLAVAFAPSVRAEQFPAGAYLAARAALDAGDFAKAASLFSETIAADPDNADLVRNGLISAVGAGNMAMARALALRLEALDPANPVASLVIVTDQVKRGRFAKALATLRKLEGERRGFERLVEGWLLVGEGRMREGLEVFAGESKELGALADYQRALALALAGDFEAAAKVFDESTALRSGGSWFLPARIEILAAAGREEEALKLARDAQADAPSPRIAALVDALSSRKDLSFDIIASAKDGLAEAQLLLARLLENRSGNERAALLYARLAEYLRPEDARTHLAVARILSNIGQARLALAALGKVPEDAAEYEEAMRLKASILSDAGQVDEAVATLDTLLEKMPDDLPGWWSKGDVLRRAERFEEARRAYDRAIALIAKPEPRHWTLFYARGITEERTGAWKKAEADFRQALALNPDQPAVLNYYGYSLLDRQEKARYAEALDMIRRAAKKRPNDGYIADSLGWGLYLTGRLDEAVKQMERAIQLVPFDPVISDHLGDVYWDAGRRWEARVQWRRALSLEPEPEAAARIRLKIDKGLDAVRAMSPAEIEAAIRKAERSAAGQGSDARHATGRKGERNSGG